MRRLRTFLGLVVLLGCWPSVRSRAQVHEQVHVPRGQSQLFIDDFLIASQTDLKRTLHQPKKDNGGQFSVLAFNDEYGEYRATLEANGTIVYDPRLNKFVMFGIGFSSHFPGPPSERIRIYRFTSSDAMNWVKGDNSAPQRINFDLKDEASGASATNTDLFSYYYDASDAAHPYKGWLHFSNWGEGREGIYYVRSADGISWDRGLQITHSGGHEIRQDGRTLVGPGDVTTFYHDPVSNRFLGSFRFSARKGVGPEGKNYLRAKAFMFVDALAEPADMRRIERVDLLPPAAAINGDLPYDEYYSATTWRYESVWLGGLKVWHSGGDYPFSAAGCAFLKLIVSRDGLHWTKVPFVNDSGVREVFIANGPEGGNNGQNDGGYMTEMSNAPLRIGDELIYYYGCSSYGKNHAADVRVSGGGIFRARLRPDGFVSVDGGTLTTKPLRFDGRDLFVNGVGPVSVRLLDAGGQVLGTADVTGDSLHLKVIFNGAPLAERVGDKAVTLSFSVGDGGKLYSFQAR